jgi:hypothetical protein
MMPWAMALSLETSCSGPAADGAQLPKPPGVLVICAASCGRFEQQLGHKYHLLSCLPSAEPDAVSFIFFYRGTSIECTEYIECHD